MPQKTPLQHPPQRLQPMQLPPLVNTHDAILVDAHYHPRAIGLALFADSVAVAWSAGGIFDAVEDVGEVGAEGFLVFFGEAVGAFCGKGGEGGEEGVGAAVGGVDASELRQGGILVRIGDNVGAGVVDESIFVREELVGFLVEEGDVFASGDLDFRVSAVKVLSDGLDGFFTVLGEVVDEGG